MHHVEYATTHECLGLGDISSPTLGHAWPPWASSPQKPSRDDSEESLAGALVPCLRAKGFEACGHGLSWVVMGPRQGVRPLRILPTYDSSVVQRYELRLRRHRSGGRTV
ncbi:hypothetical protein GUJ93_ZPchr0006g43696 [Zizania palustris]|uniref:Uncharacterized protein n=1 Tax=Zizania palustris TaxID=103762 RepID=A0A8J5W4T0_ZIZPA|nr:hypothetical protein GUJ93_ZPchr0006g43696 [Zizania palustris]